MLVRTRSGVRRRFMRGIVTHELVQRGLAFDDAYAVARAVRHAIADRGEVTTAEVRDLVERELDRMFGPEELARLYARPAPVSELPTIAREGSEQPFSRGLLARSIYAAGVDLDHAYALVVQLLGELRQEGVQRLTSDELARRVADLLDRDESTEAATRYRVIRGVPRLPRPLVIYIGGASGTGKSTLALELAPLLRIYRINATDTVRQIMRMVFSPAILPTLHGSSFEVPVAHYGDLGRRGEEEEIYRRLVAGFEEQATRVCVGVRALVERAQLETMSIVVEGVHLVPPLIPFADLDETVYQLPLVLTTLDEEVHRTRFLARGRQVGRRAERYLESFTTIRLIQEHLLAQAEACDVPVMDTTDREATLVGALRLVTGKLQQRVPWLGQPVAAGERTLVPTLLLVLDGLPDRPVAALGGRTPLQAAATPTLDRLAREGRCGQADPVAPGVVPDTVAGTLALFGQSPLAMKRGPVEALGAGLPITIEDVAAEGEQRHITIGSDALGRVLVVVYAYRRDHVRLISARRATRSERREYEGRIRLP